MRLFTLNCEKLISLDSSATEMIFVLWSISILVCSLAMSSDKKRLAIASNCKYSCTVPSVKILLSVKVYIQRYLRGVAVKMDLFGQYDPGGVPLTHYLLISTEATCD
jgi:hypothetical protein